MTDTDENLLTLAKLREQIALDGDLQGGDGIKPHAGYAIDPVDRASLNFLDDLVDEDDRPESRFEETQLGSIVHSNVRTDAAWTAVQEQRYGLASHLVGVTETEFDGSSITVSLELANQIENDGAPCFCSGAGNPNTGKSNLMFYIVDDVAGRVYDDLLVISNSRTWHRTDLVVTSAHDLTVALLEHRQTPKAVVIDEASTHFDARTYNYEVPNQWTPLAKRMAKLGVEFCGLITHSGKDLHPEAKRLTTLAFHKEQKAVATFFMNWPAESDSPSDPVFPDPVQNLEKYEGYDPDDAAPWDWNLRAGLFAEDLSWRKLLELLQESGPVDS
ncbi:hypothetical protein [Natronosalvus vescus]|uniref:hypothetical protein n=1 Tax=Natronosalvus vescus TaxID=2953881 RepID=UPI002091A800|nr:hypothetical protein [Natronosalvus vescus]